MQNIEYISIIIASLSCLFTILGYFRTTKKEERKNWLKYIFLIFLVSILSYVIIKNIEDNQNKKEISHLKELDKYKDTISIKKEQNQKLKNSLNNVRIVIKENKLYYQTKIDSIIYKTNLSDKNKTNQIKHLKNKLKLSNVELFKIENKLTKTIREKDSLNNLLKTNLDSVTKEKNKYLGLYKNEKKKNKKLTKENNELQQYSKEGMKYFSMAIVMKNQADTKKEKAKRRGKKYKLKIARIYDNSINLFEKSISNGMSKKMIQNYIEECYKSKDTVDPDTEPRITIYD